MRWSSGVPGGPWGGPRGHQKRRCISWSVLGWSWEALGVFLEVWGDPWVSPERSTCCYFICFRVLSEMLCFPDSNQYLRKNLSKVPHQNLPKATEICKKGTLGRLLKNTSFSRAYFSANVLEKPPKQDVPPLTFGFTFQHFFGPGWPVSPRPPKTLFAIPFCCKNQENHASVYYLMRFCCIVFVCIHVHAQAFLCICFRLL